MEVTKYDERVEILKKKEAGIHNWASRVSD